MNEVYEFLKQCGTYYLATTDGDFHQVAALIDRRIAQGRTTFDNNRIAKAMLDGTPLPDSKATADFQRYIDNACAQYPDCDNYRTTLLQIYANSVLNSLIR